MPRRGGRPASKNKPKPLHTLPPTGDTVRHVPLTPHLVDAAPLAVAQHSSAGVPANRPSVEETKGDSSVAVVPPVSVLDRA